MSLLATAQHLWPRGAVGLECPRRAPSSGLLTDRLSAEQIERWGEIERLVLAEDVKGQPLHPTLRGLWEWADASSHAIHLELPESSKVSLPTVGIFKIERLDPQGIRHVVVIRLYLENIDRARLRPKAVRKGGFVPFKKLGKVECYAEVLGHELAHAANILSDPERARLVEEAVEQTNGLILARHRRRDPAPLDPELRQRLIERDRLLKELEAQIVATEATIWRELRAGERAGTRVRD